jgi:hypothetical protein
MTEEERQEKINKKIQERENLKLNKSNYDPDEYRRLYHSVNNCIWSLKNPDKVDVFRKKYIKTDKFKEARRRFKKSEKGRLAIARWESSEKCKIGKLERQRRSRKNNPYATRLDNIVRKEKRQGVTSIVTKQELIDIREKFEHECFNCGSDYRLCYDHFYPLKKYKIPLSNENCVLLCNTCNMHKDLGKANKDPEEFFNKKQLSILFKKYKLKKVKYLLDRNK